MSEDPVMQNDMAVILAKLEEMNNRIDTIANQAPRLPHRKVKRHYVRKSKVSYILQSRKFENGNYIHGSALQWIVRDADQVELANAIDAFVMAHYGEKVKRPVKRLAALERPVIEESKIE